MPLDDIRNIKIKKLETLREQGIDPYPAVSARTHSIAQALEVFDSLSDKKEEVVLAGRIMAKREHGGSIFVDLNDGSAIQGLLKEDVLSKEDFKLFQDLIDIGDFMEIKGTLYTTKRGEKTIEAKSIKLLTKALQPLPEK